MDLALNNLQLLIYYETKPNQTKLRPYQKSFLGYTTKLYLSEDTDL